MTSIEKDLIKRFAAGDKSLRDEAIKIYRKEPKKDMQAQDIPIMNFMFAVDNPYPDLILQEICRKKLLSA